MSPSDPSTSHRPATIDRAVVVRTVAAVFAAFLACAVAAVVFRPADDAGPASFERAFLGACTRSGGGDDACRCALGRWQATVDEGARRALDDDLAAGGKLPAEVEAALAGC